MEENAFDLLHARWEWLAARDGGCCLSLAINRLGRLRKHLTQRVWRQYSELEGVSVLLGLGIYSFQSFWNSTKHDYLFAHQLGMFKILARRNSILSFDLYRTGSLHPYTSLWTRKLLNKSFRTVALRTQISIFTLPRGKWKMLKYEQFISAHFDTSFIEIHWQMPEIWSFQWLRIKF